jgi:hypothetical protein
VKAVDYQLIAGNLYKMGADGILRRCVLEHERRVILEEAHDGIVGGHYAGRATAQNILCVGLWWSNFTRMRRNIVSHVMYVNEWESHLGGTKCL